MLLAAALLVAFRGWSVEVMKGMEEAHVELLKVRGFTAEPWEVLEGVCESNESFSTYFVVLNVSNGSVCEEGCRRLSCNVSDVYCEHCIVRVEKAGEDLEVEVVG